MNNLPSKFQCFSRYSGTAIPYALTQKGITGFFSLGMLAIGLLGSSLGYAQDTATNSSMPPTANAASANIPSTNSPATASTNPDELANDKTPPTFKKAMMLYSQDKQDEALNTINAVLQADPKSINAYILRGTINARKQIWDQAENDYQTALKLDTTNDGVRYDLADLKFKQKQFDAARLAFVPLQENHDAEISDLIKYKIFLCDLLGGHDDVAANELAAFNQAGSNPSYYFGNAAWDLVHKKPDEAKGWLLSATNIYPPRKHALYMSILRDMGYLPLP